MKYAGCGDEAIVIVDDFFDDCKTDSGSGKLFFGMQALKHFKYFLLVVLGETDAVVLDGNSTIPLVWR